MGGTGDAQETSIAVMRAHFWGVALFYWHWYDSFLTDLHISRGAEEGTGPLVFCSTAAWQRGRGLCLINVLGSQRRGPLELSEWLLAPSMSHFRFCTVCLGNLDYVSNSPTEESAQENAVRAGELKHTQNTRGSNPRTGSLSFPAASFSWGCPGKPPSSLVFVPEHSGPALLSCSQDPNCVPDLFWYKADSTRIIESSSSKVLRRWQFRFTI